MPEKEKIGQDILGGAPRPSRMDKRKAELLEKAKQEVAKKKSKEKTEEKVKDVHVTEHLRSKPKKKRSLVEEILEFP